MAAGLTGFVMHVVFIRPVIGKPGFDTATLIATVGVSIALQAAALLVFGPSVKVVPEVLGGSFTVGGTLVTNQGLLVIATAIILFVAVNLFLRLSRHGMAIRAGLTAHGGGQPHGGAGRAYVRHRGRAQLGAGRVGRRSARSSSFFYLSPISGFNPMIQALIVTIFGGLGSVRGTIVAAYVIGALGSFLQVYLGASWALPGVFLFIIVVLIVRPNGLFGMAEARRL